MRGLAVLAATAVLGLSGCGGGDPLFEAFPAPTSAEDAAFLEQAREPEDAPSGIVYSLPKALLPLTLTRAPDPNAGGAPSLDMSADRLIITPDPDYTFTLNYEHDSVSADKVTVHTTADGLLTLVATTSRDESAGVATGIISLAGEIAKGISTGPIGAAIGAAPAAAGRLQTLGPRPTPFEVTILVDPTSPNLEQEVDDALRLYGIEGVRVKAVGMEHVGEKRTPEQLRAYCRYGACYRRSAPVRLEAYDAATRTGVTLTTTVPNHGVIGRLDFMRRSFVENQATAEFEAGMLTKVTYIDPSETNAIANAPVDMARSIFAIPGAILDSQTDDLKAQKELLDARESLLRQQTELLEAERKYREAKAKETQ